MVDCINVKDNDGRPSGGSVRGEGVIVDWQNGPVGEVGRNGAFLEDLLGACVQRLEFYQKSAYGCRENALAVTHIETAILWLGKRRADRIARGVQGTYQK